MKILVVGPREGFYARDHALAWILSQSDQVTELLVTRGNAVTSQLPKTRNLMNYDFWTVDAVVETAFRERVDLVVIGAEAPLVAGVVDRLEKVGIRVFGPNEAAAELEGKKSRAIEWMRSTLIPHPRSWIFYDQQEALEFVRKHNSSIVVKLDGLAGGKGVWVCITVEKAESAVLECMDTHPEETLVLQELRKGVEVSVFAFTDGEHISELIAACDYKPRFSGDKGPNTGSMGSFSPPVFWSEKLAERIRVTVFQPIVEEMRRRGIVYKGVLYAGLILTASGVEVLEFNCRFGDAEGQVVLSLLESDPVEVMMACIEGRLHQVPVIWNREKVSATVVMVDQNYPGTSQNNGGRIKGLDQVKEGVTVFHYGSTLIPCQNGDDYPVLNGSGRRFAVTAVGDTLVQVIDEIYEVIGSKGSGIFYPGEDWRDDIGEGRELPEALAFLYG